MTTLLAIVLSTILFWPKAPDKKTNPKEQIPNEVVQTIEAAPLIEKRIVELKSPERIEIPDDVTNKTSKVLEKHEADLSESTEVLVFKSERPTNDKIVVSEKPNQTSETTIDGQKFILELSFDELRKLGFNINHYTVLYRNSFEGKNVLYLSANPRFRVQAFVNKKRSSERLPEYIPLQSYDPDTIDLFFQLTSYRTAYISDPKTLKSGKYDYESCYNNYFPVFTSDLEGTVHSIEKHLKFEECRDTLIPVVVRFSQLESSIKTDQLFWFNTTDEFYQSLPDRYSQVKKEFESIKQMKKSEPDSKVDHHIDRWIKNQLFPSDSVIDGTAIRLKLTVPELKKIGMYVTSGGEKHSYQTLIGIGKASGGSFSYDPDNFNDSLMVNVDFLPKYSTDKYGEFRSFTKTSKEMDQFLTDKDVLLPIISDEFYDHTIYWFSISDSLWKLLPSRYRYLKQEYNRIMFNKSITPDKNWISYFKKEFERVDINVNLLKLNKKELINLGFAFDNNRLSLDCALGANWIRYRCNNNAYLLAKQKKQAPEQVKKMLENIYIQANVEYISPNRNFVDQRIADKFDSLYQAANQGFQFVYVTDTLGRQLHKINILPEEIQIDGKDFEFLIPVLVKQSEYFSELSEDKVFWFTPTEAFFNRLPSRIKDKLKAEYNWISQKQSDRVNDGACTYFESCQSTLQVEEFKVFPNPANNNATVTFKLNEPIEGKISLVDLAGRERQVLQPQTSFTKGLHRIDVDASTVPEGIYLITLYSDKGIQTQRFIVTH